MPPAGEPPEFDAESLRADLARIREKLKKLDLEREQTFKQLYDATREAERRLEERRRP